MLYSIIHISQILGFYCNMSHNMTKPTKWHVRPAKTQISLGIRPVWSESSLSRCPGWSESSLSAWRNTGSLATQDSDQTGWMPRLIWVFARCTLILLVLSCRGSSLCSSQLFLLVFYWFYSWLLYNICKLFILYERKLIRHKNRILFNNQ